MKHRTPRLLLLLSLALAGSLAAHAQTVTDVSVPQGQLSLAGRLYTPAGDGPFPAVVILHGSGGLWSNDNPANGLVTHLREWGERLQANGYIALLLDSYTARGIPGNFSNRRPAFDAAWDDSLCSSSHERPKDAHAALAWLRTRPEVIWNRIGLLGFSQGGETALAAVLSSTVNKSGWKVSRVTAWKKNADGTLLRDAAGVPVPDTFDHNHAAPAPHRPVADVNGFACVVAYYPGCGFHGYFGSVNSTDANHYLPHAPTLVLHGTKDSLWTGGLPVKLLGKAQSQANALGIANPMTQVTFADAKHSFDMAALAPQSLWDTASESPDAYAKRVARSDALQHFNTWLQAP
jgi:dienelactone hydrolase